MRREVLLGSMLLFLIFAALFVPGMVIAQETKKGSVTIYEGNYEDYMLFGLSTNEKIDISVDVISPAGASVDVYIISSTEKSDYPSETFTATEAHEDVSNIDFSFKAPDSHTYYLIIDNSDNSRSSDAIPTGDVTVEYEYDDPLYATLEGLEDVAEQAAWTATLICVSVVVVIIVVVVLIVWLIVRSSKGSQPPPQQYPPQQPYPQQGTYPPPQQQYYVPSQGEQPPVQPQNQPPHQPPGEMGYNPPSYNQGTWPSQEPQQPPVAQQPQAKPPLK